jgi:hypothetical protein
MSEYILTKIKKVIIDKDLESFWLLCDLTTFKPFKNIGLSDMKKMLKEKKEKYANRKIARCSIKFNLIKDYVFTIDINIFEINNNGEISKSLKDNWGLMFHYKLEELTDPKFSLTFLQKIIIACANKKITSDIVNGIDITLFKKKINKANIEL